MFEALGQPSHLQRSNQQEETDMEVESQIIIAVTMYKIISLLIGILFAYMGYKLFMAGIWGSAGDIEGEFNDKKIIIRKAAPGTFFALFGAIVISITVINKIDLQDYGSTTKNTKTIKIEESNDNELPEELPF